MHPKPRQLLWKITISNNLSSARRHHVKSRQASWIDRHEEAHDRDAGRNFICLLWFPHDCIRWLRIRRPRRWLHCILAAMTQRSSATSTTIHQRTARFHRQIVHEFWTWQSYKGIVNWIILLDQHPSPRNSCRRRTLQIMRRLQVVLCSERQTMWWHHPARKWWDLQRLGVVRIVMEHSFRYELGRLHQMVSCGDA